MRAILEMIELIFFSHPYNLQVDDFKMVLPITFEGPHQIRQLSTLTDSQQYDMSGSGRDLTCSLLHLILQVST